MKVAPVSEMTRAVFNNKGHGSHESNRIWRFFLRNAELAWLKQRPVP
jgi:hypothetical protein